MNIRSKRGYTISGLWQKHGFDRNAIFIFITNNGVLFIEPKYINPFNASNAMHFLEGKITESNVHIKIESSQGVLIIEADDDHGIALNFNKQAAEQGLSFASERERIADANKAHIIRK